MRTYVRSINSCIYNELPFTKRSCVNLYFTYCKTQTSYVRTYVRTVVRKQTYLCCVCGLRWSLTNRPNLDRANLQDKLPKPRRRRGRSSKSQVEPHADVPGPIDRWTKPSGLKTFSPNAAPMLPIRESRQLSFQEALCRLHTVPA